MMAETLVKEGGAVGQEAGPALEVVLKAIREEGPLPYDRFMELCLYHPARGYYRRGREPRGDFVTAPEISPVFGRIVGRFVAGAAAALAGPPPLHVLELGAGSGLLAAGAASGGSLGPLLARGEVVWTAADVAYARSGPAAAGPFHPVAAEGPAAFRNLSRAVVVANEFFDALPCRVVEFRGGRWAEVMVAEKDGGLAEVSLPVRYPGLERYLSSGAPPGVEGARLEVHLAAGDVLRRLAEAVDTGLLLIIDYGGGAELLWPRAMSGGTLRSFRSQSVLESPLGRPGLADITADVNFDDLAGWGAGCGWRVVHRGQQIDFLLSQGLLDEVTALAEEGRAGKDLAAYLAAKRFLLGEGLQENYRVMVLGRGPVAAGGSLREELGLGGREEA